MPGPSEHARTEAGAHPPRRGGHNSHLGRAVDRRGREAGGPGIGGPSGVPSWCHQWPWATPASIGPGPCLGLEGHGAQPRGGRPLCPPARLAPALDSLRSLCPFWLAWVRDLLPSGAWGALALGAGGSAWLFLPHRPPSVSPWPLAGLAPCFVHFSRVFQPHCPLPSLLGALSPLALAFCARRPLPGPGPRLRPPAHLSVWLAFCRVGCWPESWKEKGPDATADRQAGTGSGLASKLQSREQDGLCLE